MHAEYKYTKSHKTIGTAAYTRQEEMETYFVIKPDRHQQCIYAHYHSQSDIHQTFSHAKRLPRKNSLDKYGNVSKNALLGYCT